MFFRSKNTFMHYDSSHGMNLSAATKCAHKLTSFISGESLKGFSFSTSGLLLQLLQLHRLSIMTKLPNN